MLFSWYFIYFVGSRSLLSRGVSSPFFPARAEPSQFFFEPSEPRAIKSLLRAYTSQKFYHSSLIHASKIFAKNQTAKKMGPIIDQDLASNGRNFYKFILLVNYFRNLDYILRTIVTVRAYWAKIYYPSFFELSKSLAWSSQAFQNMWLTSQISSRA